jgi:pimeloyl-ACP methyl ester carboxylesterase
MGPSGDIDTRQVRIQGDGVTLHATTAGSGPPVVLLHGFPENARSWSRQFAPLVRAGYAVWAPDLRGYRLSDRPRNRDSYHLRHLVADVAAIVRATGHPRAHVGGHDWGGLVAWTFAGYHPDLLDKLVIFNAPHFDIYLKQVWRSTQMFRSWYVLFFRLPFLPERALSANRFAVVRDMFRRMPVRPGTFSEDDIEQYIQALSVPGALTAALNYYRANAAPDALKLARRSRVAAETLVVWGERDRALGTSLLDGLETVAPRVRIERIADAGHWVQNEAPELVNRLLLEFLGPAQDPRLRGHADLAGAAARRSEARPR